MTDLWQEQEFVQKQQQELDASLKKIIQQQKTELATIERECLNNKQQLLRGIFPHVHYYHIQTFMNFDKGSGHLVLFVHKLHENEYLWNYVQHLCLFIEHRKTGSTVIVRSFIMQVLTYCVVLVKTRKTCLGH